MIRIKNQEKNMVCLFYFHSFCQDCHPICPENHMQKEFLLFLQEIDYKKANGSQMIELTNPS